MAQTEHERAPCGFCRSVGEHKKGCSAAANVVPFPKRRPTIRVVNNTPHHLGMRATAEPTVFEVICIHTADPGFVAGPRDLMEIAMKEPTDNG